MISAMIGGAIGRGETVSPAALPALSAANALSFGNPSGITRFGSNATLTNGISIPAGDWSIGFFIRVPTNTLTNPQCILGTGASGTPYTGASTFSILYRSTDGSFSVHGLDASSNALGSHSHFLPTSNTNTNALISRHPVMPGDMAHVHIQKSGSFAQIFITPAGNAPVMSCESFTAMGAITTALFLGIGRDSSNPIKLDLRGLYKLSYALTKAQIAQVANGVLPTTLGTPAADDFYFPLDVNAATINSSINGVTFARVFNNCAVVTGVGYAAQTNAVMLDVTKEVYQFFNGNNVNIPVSGVYAGADGYDIEAQIIDYTGAGVSAWKTIAVATTGGAFSGILTVPKGKRLLRVQLRKSLYGVPLSDVMTTTYRFGVGFVQFESGQSLSQHYGSTALPYSDNVVTPNGFVFIQRDIGPRRTLSGKQATAITSVVDNGSGKCRVTVAAPGHGLERGEEVYNLGIGGTTEANGRVVATPVSRTQYDLLGVNFVNAYTSGGYMYAFRSNVILMDNTKIQQGDGNIILGNGISNLMDCVACINNVAEGGQAIAQFMSLGVSAGLNNYSAAAILAARYFNGVGAYTWFHGHANVGTTTYFMDSGTWGSEVGLGNVGTLKTLIASNFPGQVKFGLCGFTALGGTSSASADAVHNYRLAAERAVNRAILGGDSAWFYAGDYGDLVPQWENFTTQNAHLSPYGYRVSAARQAHATSFAFGFVGNSATGPQITSGSRAGSVVTLNLTHNGGSSVTIPDTALEPTGFEVATDTAFTSPVAISSAAIVGGNQIRLNLASDPGATVYVRYQYGYPGNYGTGTYFTGRITGVADNGSGLIRITTADPVTPATPSGSQRVGGHGLNTGNIFKNMGIAGAIQANIAGRATRIDANNFDIQGSSSAGLGAFTANSNLWQANATGVVALELAEPLYDNRTIGTYDSQGAPVRPTSSYITAA